VRLEGGRALDEEAAEPEGEEDGRGLQEEQKVGNEVSSARGGPNSARGGTKRATTHEVREEERLGTRARVLGSTTERPHGDICPL